MTRLQSLSPPDNQATIRLRQDRAGDVFAWRDCKDGEDFCPSAALGAFLQAAETLTGHPDGEFILSVREGQLAVWPVDGDLREMSDEYQGFPARLGLAQVHESSVLVQVSERLSDRYTLAAGPRRTAWRYCGPGEWEPSRTTRRGAALTRALDQGSQRGWAGIAQANLRSLELLRPADPLSGLAGQYMQTVLQVTGAGLGQDLMSIWVKDHHQIDLARYVEPIFYEMDGRYLPALYKHLATMYPPGGPPEYLMVVAGAMVPLFMLRHDATLEEVHERLVLGLGNLERVTDIVASAVARDLGFWWCSWRTPDPFVWTADRGLQRRYETLA